MHEILPSLTGRENEANHAAEFITCLNGYPQASTDTFESAIARAHDFWLFGSEQEISIYEVKTGIHYDLDLALMISSRQSGGDMYAI